MEHEVTLKLRVRGDVTPSEALRSAMDFCGSVGVAGMLSRDMEVPRYVARPADAEDGWKPEPTFAEVRMVQIHSDAWPHVGSGR